jgi:hypothetical protein
MYHYTYRIILEQPTDARKYYIGVRSSKRYPTEDSYMGSSKPLREWMETNGSGVRKEVLAIWPSRKLAGEHELALHIALDVVLSEEYFNLTTGKGGKVDGAIGYAHTEETKRKISESGKGRIHSDETLKKLSEKAKSRDPAVVAKMKERCIAMAAARKGKKISQEHKAQISSTLKTRYSDPANRNSMPNNIGRKMTQETKNKISAANKGKRRTQEYCERMRKNRKPVSAETRKKMSAARLRNPNRFELASKAATIGQQKRKTP